MCPLLAFFLLYRSIKSHENNKVTQYLLILYQGLKRKRFYWEFVNTLRKVLLLSCLMFSSDSMKIVLSMTILVITIRIQLYLKPYRKEENNKVEILAVTAGLVTLMSSLLFISDEPVVFINICMVIFIIFINTLFILEWFYEVLFWVTHKGRLFQIMAMFLELVLRKDKKFILKLDKEELEDNNNQVQTRKFKNDFDASEKIVTKKLLKGPRKGKRCRRSTKKETFTNEKWCNELEDLRMNDDLNVFEIAQINSNRKSIPMEENKELSQPKLAKSQFMNPKLNSPTFHFRRNTNDTRKEGMVKAIKSLVPQKFSSFSSKN